MVRAFFFGALAFAGCAPLSVESDMQRMREQLAESERARADLARRVEDLEGRVLALTEKTERPVATTGASPTGAAPVVTLHTPTPPEPTPLAGDDGSDAPRAPVATIRMEGAPALVPPTETPAPAPAPHAATEARTPIAPTLPPSGDNLGVVPLPDHGVPLAHAGATIAAPPVERRARETRPARPTTRRAHDDATSLAQFRAAEAKLHGDAVDDAVVDLRAFVHAHPDSDLADDAVFDVGDAHAHAREWSAAADAYAEVADRWPSGNRAPEALAKLASCLQYLGRTDDARATFERLVAAYPSSDAAAAARHHLAQLGRAPHAAAENR